jgi:uncharacterized repeat protein (TIGR01451 family)
VSRKVLFLLVLMMSGLLGATRAQAQTANCSTNEITTTFTFGGVNSWPSGTTSKTFTVGTAPASAGMGVVLTPSVAFDGNYPQLDQLSTTPNSLEIDHDGNAQASLLSTMVINFSRPVTKLRFTAMDVDSVTTGGSRFRDQLVITANNAGAVQPVTLTAFNTSRVAVTSNAAGATATATLNGGNCTTASDACNVFVNVAQTVTQVIVAFRAGPGTGNGTTLQAVAYNTFGFCMPVPDYQLVKDGPASATRGTTETYVFRVANTGLSAVTAGQVITVKDVLAAGASFVTPPSPGGAQGANWSCVAGTTTAAADTVTCTSAAPIAVGATSTFSLPVAIAPGAPATLVNRAKVYGGGDPDKLSETDTGLLVACTQAAEGTSGPGANAGCAFEQTAVDSEALLAISKTNGVNTLTAGGTTSYTITATNGGPSPADATVIADPQASGLACTQVQCTAQGGAGCPGGLTVSDVEDGFAIPSFPANSTLTLTLTCGVRATGL